MVNKRRNTRFSIRQNARMSEDLKKEEIELLGNYRELDVFFADDSRQLKPSRNVILPLVGIGGLNISGNSIYHLNVAIEETCEKAGFLPNEEFKWSPSRELWMYHNLRNEKRKDFFLNVIRKLEEHEVIAFIIVRDTECRSATGAATPELDATTMFLERVHHQCNKNYSCGMVVVDRPSGSRSEEDKFLGSCLETIQQGTRYANMGTIVHNVVSTPSKLSRLLQAADVIIGSSISYIAGEKTYSPQIFEAIIPLLYNDGSRIGGYGLKLHPAFRYFNLYYWLVGDTHFWRMNVGIPLPRSGFMYASDPYKK